jgi:hypothetical protein
MQSKLERDVRFLKIYATAATLVGTALVFTAFAQQARPTKFEEIDVERTISSKKMASYEWSFPTRRASIPES